jgi:hypothetical protein
MTTINGIIEVYDMINYIRRYLLKNDVPNFSSFPYFEYDNLIYVILNGLNGGIIENNIIYFNYYKIYINQNDNLYEIFIEFNDLTEPTGPI